MQLLVGLSNQSVVKPCGTESVLWSVEHFFVEYFASDFRLSLSDPVAIHKVGDVARISRNNSRLPVSRNLN